MFVNIIQFPPIKTGKEDKFLEWFVWSNQEYAKHQGFIRRRLLKPRDGSHYTAIVEHESYETFMAMHTSPTQAEAARRVKSLLEGEPTPAFYASVIE